MKDKIEEICYNLELGNIDWEEATEALLLLCNSSLQLKEKEKINFEDWAILNGYKRIGNSYVYKRGNSNYDREQLRRFYNTENLNL